MEVYVLDSLLRRETVVDRFESLIWTERFADIGDFELNIRSSLESRSLFKTGALLACNESFRVMRVKTVENGIDSEGKSILKVKGPSLESALLGRTARPSLASLTTTPTWDLNGPPMTLARKVFDDVCRSGILSVYDKIPFITPGTFMPGSNIAEPVDPVVLKLPPQSVYKVIKDLADVWTFGFRLVRKFDTSQLYFDVYTGSNRTTGQSVLSPVVFAPGLDNLQNTRELNTTEDAFNVAYVSSPAGSLMVYPSDVPPDTDGFDREVLTVVADDITTETPNFEAALLQRGKEALAEHRAFQAFDGEISQRSQFKYGIDYHLGDLVEMRNEDGLSNQMRITEQIFVSDREGERSYPTLSLNTFINTGSWLSWESNKQWIDYDADMTSVWANQP